MRGRIQTIFAILLLALVPAAAPSLARAAPEEDPSGRTIEWQNGADVFAAADELTIDREVEGSLSAAGRIVILTRDARVGGDTWITGRRVAVEGGIEGDLTVTAQEALLNGHVKGDVSFYGLDLSFGPDAKIDGDVAYYSPSAARIDKGAEIAGDINGKDFVAGKGLGGEAEPRTQMRERWRDDHMRERWRDRGGLSAPGYHMSAGGAVFFGILAIALALIAPATSARMRDGLASEPALALGLGLFWLLGIPVLIVLVAITIIGLPIAFLLLMLWPFGMVFGLVALLVALGELIASRLGETGRGTLGRIVGIVLATAIVWIGISIPVLGALVWLAAVAGGIGLLYIGLRAIDRVKI